MRLIRSLNVSGLRNLMDASLSGAERVNLLFGDNGAGKTSFLEAINFLGEARSFRGSKVQALITRGEESCFVRGVLTPAAYKGAADNVLGVKRSASGGLAIRYAGRKLLGVSELLGVVPVQVINADSFCLLTGGPAHRRRFLDWGVFHVERNFFSAWRDFQRCLKQRNNLLRSHTVSAAELDVWTKKLADLGETVSAYRQSYFRRLVPYFWGVLSRIAPEIEGMGIDYYPGWDRKMTLRDAFRVSNNADRSRGFTQTGPQRADIRLTWQGRAASDTLSRGQQKLVVCGLKLAQGSFQVESFPGQAVYLLDDLPSELDPPHLEMICDFLAKLKTQIFITSVLPDTILRAFPCGASLTMFHVERGQARCVTGTLN